MARMPLDAAEQETHNALKRRLAPATQKAAEISVRRCGRPQGLN